MTRYRPAYYDSEMYGASGVAGERGGGGKVRSSSLITVVYSIMSVMSGCVQRVLRALSRLITRLVIW